MGTIIKRQAAPRPPARRKVRASSWGDLPRESRPFWPRGAALEILYDRAPEILISGPTGTGKSRPVLEKLHLIASKYPRARIAMLRRVRKSLTQSVMVTYEQHVLTGREGVAFHGMSQEYRYPNQSVIVVGGLDQASKILSTEFDVMYINEGTEVGEEQYETCLTRLRNGRVPYQQMLVDCNPGPPNHWLKARCDRGAMTMYKSWLKDNPIFFDPITEQWTPAGLAYQTMLDNLTGVRRKRLRDGIWAAAEGIIYEGWDPERHHLTGDQFNALLGRPAEHAPEIPLDWPRFISIDFGYRHPMCVQWWALDHDWRMYLYREIYVTGRLVEDLAGEIADLSAGEEIVAVVTDHDAEDRATLERHLGCTTTPAVKEVGRGIQEVQARLRLDATGRPRLCVFRDALVQPDSYLVSQNLPWCTAQEFESYVWDTKNGKTITEQPLKTHDHGMDALRYAVMFVVEGLAGGSEDITKLL